MKENLRSDRSHLADRIEIPICADGTEGVQVDVRCGCGNLLARAIPGGIELKCRRCQRKVVLSFGREASAER
jgi:hypothetical protein